MGRLPENWYLTDSLGLAEQLRMKRVSGEGSSCLFSAQARDAY